MKIYDRNRNVLTLGQRVMIAATGAVDTLKEAHTDNLTPYEAEHEKCVLLANSQGVACRSRAWRAGVLMAGTGPGLPGSVAGALRRWPVPG